VQELDAGLADPATQHAALALGERAVVDHALEPTDQLAARADQRDGAAVAFGAQGVQRR
jgi:hypothetical protein